MIPRRTASHSSLGTLGDCGYKWTLTREREEVKQTPSLAQIGGRAFHEYLDKLEMWKLGLGDKPRPFIDLFTDELYSAEQESGLTSDKFTVSGRQTKDHPNKEDIDVWARELGPSLIEKYVEHDWSEWPIATDLPPDVSGKTVGIEYHVRLDDPDWQQHVDQIRRDKFGNHLVVDSKTWQRAHEEGQLDKYGAGLKLWGLRRVNHGAYWDARKGKLIGPRFLRWSESMFRYYIRHGQMMHESEIRLPVLGDHCAWCNVRKLCEFNPNR